MGDASFSEKLISMARFFVTKDNIEGSRGVLEGAELEHMRKVLRLRPGEDVVLFDDQGREHEAVIRSYGSRMAVLEIVRSYRPERESPLDVILAQAVGKGEKMDWVVEKATELGVCAILPFFSSYTIPKLEGEKIVKRRARWGKIALSAAKQSGRTKIPEVMEATDFAELIRRPWGCNLKLIFWAGASSEGLGRIKEGRHHIESALLAIGPEGGFSDEEVRRASDRGFVSVRLGSRIMRTETAALSALSVVQSLWGDMG